MMSPSIFLSKFGRKTIRCLSLLQRNKYNTKRERIQSNQVSLEWVSNGNLGDELAPIIYNWMLERKGLSQKATIDKPVHLMTVGSMVGSWSFDAVIWGSGIHLFSNLNRLFVLKGIQKFDIRAVRGPITRSALRTYGHECSEVYGDPAVLMPLIYSPKNIEKKYKTSVVLHYHADSQWQTTLDNYSNLYYLNIGTNDFRYYIHEMLSSEKIISSSLHGIILAETYGIPAVFLNTGGYVDDALMKYYDWYYSTGRYSVKMARTLEEAIIMQPMPLPDIGPLQTALLDSFPYDLWKV